MPLGFIYWLLWFLGLVFSLWGGYPYLEPMHRRFGGLALFCFVMFFLIGWHLFGFVVKG